MAWATRRRFLSALAAGAAGGMAGCGAVKTCNGDEVTPRRVHGPDADPVVYRPPRPAAWPMHGRGPRNTWSVPDDALAGPHLFHRFTFSLPVADGARNGTMEPTPIGEATSTPRAGTTPPANDTASTPVTGTAATTATVTGTTSMSATANGVATANGTAATADRNGDATETTTDANASDTGRTATATARGRSTRRLWPVAVDDRLYVADETGAIRALRANDGSEVWGADAVAPAGPVAVGDGAVYASGPGVLVALDRADGTVRWRYELGSRFGVPVLARGAVFVTGRERLHAVEVHDGTRRWMVPTGDDPGRPAVTDTAVYVASYRGGTVTALDPSDGERLWQQAGDFGYLGHVNYTEYDGTRPPAVRGGTVYVPQGHAIVALDPADGGVDWTWESNGNDYLGTLAVTNDRVFYKAFFRPHETLKDTMFALPAGGDKPTWCRSIDGATLTTTPVAGSGRVLAQFGGVGGDERLVAFDAATGDAVWTFGGYEGRALSPVVAGGSLYIGTDAGRLYGLKLG